MRVLVACEYSGTVRDAFIRAGHYAESCDLLPSESSFGPHWQGDIGDMLVADDWDLMIAHPPCTFLSVSGMHWTTRGLRDPQLNALRFVQMLMDAPIDRICIENHISVISSRIRKPDQIIQPWWFGDDASKKTCLWLKNLPKLELNINQVVSPRGWSKVMSAADMVECECCGEPYCPECDTHYADCECIGPTEDDVETKTVDGVLFGSRLNPAPKMRWANQCDSGQNKLGPSDDRWKERSRTYQGIADAMAAQWGNP